MEGPVFAGASQPTVRLVVLPGVAHTEGAAGRPGASFTSVTVIVTVTVALPPLPSTTLTITT